MTARLSLTTSTDNSYSEDYYLWLSHTARLVSEGKFLEVDILFTLRLLARAS